MATKTVPSAKGIEGIRYEYIMIYIKIVHTEESVFIKQGVSKMKVKSFMKSVQDLKKNNSIFLQSGLLVNLYPGLIAIMGGGESLQEGSNK